MLDNEDVERGQDYKTEELIHERQSLLPTSKVTELEYASPPPPSKARFGVVHLIIAFICGALASIVVQYAIGFTNSTHYSSSFVGSDLAEPDAGSTQRHNFPPSSPTNVYPSLFPTKVGYPGGRQTGAEPALVATAPSYPIHTGAAELVLPETLSPHKNSTRGKFNLFRKWGHLSPWYSVERGTFGLDSTPDPPKSCRVTGLHLLHRHGARYPTRFDSPAEFAAKLHRHTAKWNATGDLEFLNDWTYKLGEELLTPFGRQQLYDLGVSMRLKYGFLLENFTESNTLPVFRTESQDRMLASAQNFALGFFGYPLKDKYQQSITIEHKGFNNTLSPYKTCPNADVGSKGHRGTQYTKNWTEVYLQDARARLAPQIEGLNLTIKDLYHLQQACAYETVALGFSKFCALFTQDEWDGFDYALDLTLWYSSAFGAPLAKVLGAGYVQELVARLTHTPIREHRFSTNSTLDDNDITFPLNQSLYVDATHDVVILHVLTALNLTNFAAMGPLPADHIPMRRTFKAHELSPFASNVQFQLLECTSVPGEQIRIIVNDGVSPLTGIKGCPKQKDGMCPVDKFVVAQKEILSQIDWKYGCYGDWEIPDGWQTTTGEPPKRR